MHLLHGFITPNLLLFIPVPKHLGHPGIPLGPIPITGWTTGITGGITGCITGCIIGCPIIGCIIGCPIIGCIIGCPSLVVR